MLRRRIERLELALAKSHGDEEDELQSIRQEALDRLEHSDRRAISRMAVMYATGEEVINTPDIDATMARWSNLIAEIQREKQQERRKSGALPESTSHLFP